MGIWSQYLLTVDPHHEISKSAAVRIPNPQAWIDFPFPWAPRVKCLLILHFTFPSYHMPNSKTSLIGEGCRLMTQSSNVLIVHSTRKQRPGRNNSLSWTHGSSFYDSQMVRKIIMAPEHLLKLTVSIVCEPSHAFGTDYYHFRDIAMDYKVKRLLFLKST